MIFFHMLLKIKVNQEGKHGIQLMPKSIVVRLLMFVDDIDTPVGMKNKLNVLVEESAELGLTVNSEKTKIVAFRNGGFLAEHEKSFLGEAWLNVVNEFIYLGAIFIHMIVF